MNKKIFITESELVNLINGIISESVLSEQVVQGKGGDPYEYRKSGNNFYARKKGSKKWIKTSGKV